MGRGQPKLDIAFRAQNWFWYWLVKCASQLSDDDLDDLFAGSAGAGKRPRTFYRYRGLGSSPKDMRGYLKNRQSVYDRVHGETNEDRKRFQEAERVHNSELWELLTVRTVTISRCREISRTIIATLGLTRIEKDEAKLLTELVNDSQALIEFGHTRPDEDALKHFEDANDISVIALLASLYKVALANHELTRAMALKDAAERVAINFIVRWRPPEFLQSLLFRLLADRIFGNFWLTEDDWLAETEGPRNKAKRSGSEATRRREVHAFVNWYISSMRKAGRPEPEDFGLPILSTPALQWTRENREALEAWHWATYRHQCKIGVFEDSPLEEDRELAALLDAESHEMRASATNLLLGLLAPDSGFS